MKKILLSLTYAMLLICGSLQLSAQIAINTDGSLPDNSAMLDVKSISKGILVPRLTTTQRTTISSPAEGLIVYDTDLGAFYYFHSGSWVPLNNGSSGWSLTGNSGTNPASNFIGTTDNNALVIKVNNINSGKIEPDPGRNTMLGYKSQFSNTIGTGNTCTGFQSLYSNTSGSNNIANGVKALYSNTTGFSNIAIGNGALYTNTLRSNLVAIGDSALFNNYYLANSSDAEGSWNTAVGSKALFSNTTGYSNTAVGYRALYSHTQGGWNCAFGAYALYNFKSSWGNTAMGACALYSDSIGIWNTSVGYYSLYANKTGGYNTAIGMHALRSNNGNQNTAIGPWALYNNTNAGRNIAIGYTALNTQSFGNNGTQYNSDNIAIGYQALFSNQPSYTGQWYGIQNVALGNWSMQNNTSGNYNTAIGNNALLGNSTGYANTACGYNALAYCNNGTFNAALGYDAGTNSLGGIDNTTSINNHGYQNQWYNQVFIGNQMVYWIGGQVGWSTYSDERIKRNIKHDVPGLAFISKLKPVTYHLDIHKQTELTGNVDTADFPHKYDIEQIKMTGFLAQDVARAAAECNYEFSGVEAPKTNKMLYTLTYEQFVVPLVKAVQELNAINEAQKITNDELKQAIEQLKTQNEQLMQIINKTGSK